MKSKNDHWNIIICAVLKSLTRNKHKNMMRLKATQLSTEITIKNSKRQHMIQRTINYKK